MDIPTLPDNWADKRLGDFTADELRTIVESDVDGGIFITFAGKANARGLARRVRPRVTNTVATLGHGSAEERSRNILIEGDNLQAMTTLYRERGNVDLILADPPYNTGFDWRYNDRWEEDPNDSGIGEFVSADDDGRHTKWMRFMWPRLRMMRDMLRPSGVLAICIDHRELFRLGQMLDELFDEKNRLAIINWQKQTSPKNQETSVSSMTEYILVYAKDIGKASTGLVERSSATRSAYRNPDNDLRGEWTPSDPTLMGASTHPGQVYGIQNPFTGKIHYPQEGRCWRNERSKMKAGVEEWDVEYGDVQLDDGLQPALLLKGATDPRPLDDPLTDPATAAARERALARRQAGNWPQYFWRNDRSRNPGAGELRYKTYIEEIKKGVVPTTFWADEDFDLLDLGSISWEHEMVGTSDVGKAELNAIVGRGHGFDTVKPLGLFSKIITIWSPKDGLVVDPFAGSGTTGHAVLLLNHEAGSERRFICIEQGSPDRGDPYARTLTADRLRRACAGDWVDTRTDRPASLGGFEYKRLGKKVDASVLLQMERDEMVDTVVASHFDAMRRRGDRLVRIEGSESPYRYLVARDGENEGFFLVWDGPDQNTDFNESVYEACADEAARANVRPRPLHVYARLYKFQSDAVRFYQIPDRILADFGLDLSSEPFAVPDDD